jgi:hypothetical protein
MPAVNDESLSSFKNAEISILLNFNINLDKVSDITPLLQIFVTIFVLSGDQIRDLQCYTSNPLRQIVRLKNIFPFFGSQGFERSN